MILTKKQVLEIVEERLSKQAAPPRCDDMVWEVGKAHYFDSKGKPISRPSMIVRPRSGISFNCFCPGYHEQVVEVRLPDLLRQILNALDQLGIELVQERAKPASWTLKKRDVESPSDPTGVKVA